MKIRFCLLQDKSPRDSKRAIKIYFKLDLCHNLFLHYTDRISHYRSVELSGISFSNFESLANAAQSAKILCCDLGEGAKSLTSDAVAQKIQAWEGSGFQTLFVIVGAANGFSTAERASLKQRGAIFWSFGAQTLPHDLAAVIASEQIYRAFTIIKGEPYHLGH